MKIRVVKEGRFFAIRPTRTEEFLQVKKLIEAMELGNSLKFVRSSPPLELFGKHNFVPILGAEDLSGDGKPLETKFDFYGHGLDLVPDTLEDKFALNVVRTPCFWLYPDTKPILFAKKFKSDGLPTLYFTSGNCPVCQRFSVGYFDLAFMCDECAKKCEHDYKYYITTGLNRNRKIRWIIRSFCKHCRRPDPNFDAGQFTEREHTRFVEDALGNRFKVIYADDYLAQMRQARKN